EGGVDPAVGIERLRARARHRVRIGDVADDAGRLDAERLDACGRHGIAIGRPAPDADFGTRGRQRLCHAEADAAVAAGDDGDLAGQVEGAIGHGWLPATGWQSPDVLAAIPAPGHRSPRAPHAGAALNSRLINN